MSVLPFGKFLTIGQSATAPEPGIRVGGEFAQILADYDEVDPPVETRGSDRRSGMLSRSEEGPHNAMHLPEPASPAANDAIDAPQDGDQTTNSELAATLFGLPVFGQTINQNTATVPASASGTPIAANNETATPLAAQTAQSGANGSVSGQQASTADQSPKNAALLGSTGADTSRVATSQQITPTGQPAMTQSGQAGSFAALLSALPSGSGAPAPTAEQIQAAQAVANSAAKPNGASTNTPSGKKPTGSTSAITSSQASGVNVSAATTNATKVQAAQPGGVVSAAKSPTQQMVDVAGLPLQSDLEGDAATQSQFTDVNQMALKPEMTAQIHARSAGHQHAAAVLSQVSQQMIERFDGRNSKFEIRLDPAELGKIQIKIEVDGSGRVQAVLAASDATAADALTRGLRSLENALTQAGLSLSENGLRVEVNDRNPNNPFSAQNENSNGGSNGHPAEADDETNPAEALSPHTPDIQIWSQSRLDVRA